jgi:hypothetical protein
MDFELEVAHKYYTFDFQDGNSKSYTASCMQEAFKMLKLQYPTTGYGIQTVTERIRYTNKKGIKDEK